MRPSTCLYIFLKEDAVKVVWHLFLCIFLVSFKIELFTILLLLPYYITSDLLLLPYYIPSDSSDYIFCVLFGENGPKWNEIRGKQ